MILNLRTKLVISEEESWSDIDLDEYKLASQRRFVEEYDRCGFIASASHDSDSRHDLNPSRHLNSTSIRPSTISKSKRPRLSFTNDEAYQTALLNRSSKHHRHDFDRYIQIPNNSAIVDSLSWWRENQYNYPDLAIMARDVLSVLASECTVECVFSISGTISIWQRHRLNADTISTSMLYKYAIVKISNPLYMDEPTHDVDMKYAVLKTEGDIPEKWMQNWWFAKLDKV